MTNPRLSRILVPLDGSTTAEAVLSHLRRIVDRHESQLILLQALPEAPTVDEKDAEKYLRRISFRLTNEGYPTCHIIRRGMPAEAILDLAEEEQATLIAMTTHGRTGAARWMLGSVAEKVLQASPRPVLVTRSFPSTQSRGKLEELPIRNVLVPLDGSRFSLAVLEPVLELVRSVDAHVRLLHVHEPTPYDGRWDSPDEILKAADHLLREACIPATIEQRKGDPGEEILKAAVETGSDLIAMTTHGRSGPSRWVFGSVTAKVLRSAPIPLLVVRHAVTGTPAATVTLKESAP
ncbi:MAG TPA: universal stress protein [Planctomycetota bacterium]|jgi:nucleotide-binding universal stress UspA family protein|nr:universal stress protein [Planctomycetota bacterium]